MQLSLPEPLSIIAATVPPMLPFISVTQPHSHLQTPAHSSHTHAIFLTPQMSTCDGVLTVIVTGGRNIMCSFQLIQSHTVVITTSLPTREQISVLTTLVRYYTFKTRLVWCQYQ